MNINFYIGYDAKEDIAYRVCKYSLIKRASINVKVISLKLDELISKNLYTRMVAHEMIQHQHKYQLGF